MNMGAAPFHTLLVVFLKVHTARTPGRASASEVSMLSTLAWA